MKARIKILIFISILGGVFTGLLVGVDSFTAPIVKNYKAKRHAYLVLKILGIEYNDINWQTVHQAKIRVIEKDGIVVYQSLLDSSKAFEISGAGFLGPITGLVALEPDNRTIREILILSQQETPGLGSRIADPEFLDRFKGKRITEEFKIVPPGKAKRENDIDAITGATMSCKAIERILNDEIKKYRSGSRQSE